MVMFRAFKFLISIFYKVLCVSYAIKPVPKPVPPLQDPIRSVHNLTLEKYDTAAIHFESKQFPSLHFLFNLMCIKFSYQASRK